MSFCAFPETGAMLIEFTKESPADTRARSKL
jgi:hypothetical protein